MNTLWKERTQVVNSKAFYQGLLEKIAVTNLLSQIIDRSNLTPKIIEAYRSRGLKHKPDIFDTQNRNYTTNRYGRYNSSTQSNREPHKNWIGALK